MERLQRIENPSFPQMKRQLQAITERVNIITQSGKILPNDTEAGGDIVLSEKSWAILMPGKN